MAGSSTDLRISGNDFEEYKCDGNDAINFKLVRRIDDIDNESLEFKPTMCHQIFGDSEQIFGYKDLKVDVYCTAASMTTYVRLSYSDKITAEQTGGVEADDVLQTLSKHLQPGFLTNIDDFSMALPKDSNFMPYGAKIHSYSLEQDGEKRQFDIYHTTLVTPAFRSFHERIQPFLLFYVDAASYLDVDDEKWEYYLLFERYRVNGNDPQWAFVGYMTMYNYYAYPDKIRPRLSQFLILPPFQRMGHGAELLQAFYNSCYTKAEILDITVEDPSEDFQRLRDFLDVKNCSELPAFQPQLLANGYSEDMFSQAQEKLKINKRQSRRVYEILRLKSTTPFKKEEYRNFRLDVKKRLNIPFQKKQRDFAKLSKVLNSAEIAATVSNLNDEQRQTYLQKEFEQLVEDYQRVIDRVKTA